MLRNNVVIKPQKVSSYLETSLAAQVYKPHYWLLIHCSSKDCLENNTSKNFESIWYVTNAFINDYSLYLLFQDLRLMRMQAQLQAEFEPLAEKKLQLDLKARKHADRVIWFGMCMRS